AAIAGNQLSQAETVRQAVERAAADAKDSLGEQVAKLQEARQTVSEAQGWQARAEGKGQEAEAKQLVQQIAQLLREQDGADRAAQDIARGKANSPLTAASQQQEVADGAGQLTKQAPSVVSQPLAQAAKSAADAAKETLGGSPPKAEAARRKTRDALRSAQKAAQELAARAAQTLAGPPDAAAQG